MNPRRRSQQVFQRANRCRTAYTWVRRCGYLLMLIGVGLILYGKTQGEGSANAIGPFMRAGFLCFIAMFTIFLASYALYFAIRIIEMQPNPERDSK